MTMDHPYIKVPISMEVSASEVLEGISEIKGTLTFSEGVIGFFYRTMNMAQKPSEGVTVPISLDDIQDVAFRERTVPMKIILYPRRLDVMKDMPGAKRDKMEFQVKRGQKKEALKWVSLIQNKLYEAGATGMESVPFQLSSTNLGFTEHSGLLYLDDEFLVFDILSGLSGISRGERQLIKIEPSALERVRLERRGFKHALLIKPKKMDLLDVVPGTFESEVKLKIARRDYRAADRLVSRLQYLLTGV